VEDRVNPVTGPVLAGGLLYVPYTSGDMVAYDPATGEERWRAVAGVRDQAGEMIPHPGLPLVAEGVLFTSSNRFGGAFTVALDASTGEELWSVPTGEFSAGAPALYEGELLVGSDSGELLALDPATGAELWRLAIPDEIDNDLNQASPPLAAGERIYVRDRAGGVVALGVTN
jgi:outer membrane protein assembly factor BamB